MEMHNLNWFSRLFSNTEVNNHIHAVLIQRSRIGLPPICKQGLSSSSGMSYWFSKQSDVNWGEASLINLPGNTNTFVNSLILWKVWGKEEQIRSVPHALIHASVLAYLTSLKTATTRFCQYNKTTWPLTQKPSCVLTVTTPGAQQPIPDQVTQSDHRKSALLPLLFQRGFASVQDCTYATRLQVQQLKYTSEIRTLHFSESKRWECKGKKTSAVLSPSLSGNHLQKDNENS